ncbi:MAG: hypothetical protein JSV49_06815, partial [Thermoplasmata archaeon]
FEFSGTGRLKISSSDGTSFDVTLDEFVLKEQDGARVDYHFHGSGTYTNPPLDGTIEIEYTLLGLDTHDNWAGKDYLCEKYRIETSVQYELESTTFEIYNRTLSWIIAEKSAYEDTTIYYDYVENYAANNTILEQKSGSYYPQGAPRSVTPKSDILSVIDLEGVVPTTFFIQDSVVLSSTSAFTVQYNGTVEGQQTINSEQYATTTVTGKVIQGGTGGSTTVVVNSGKYAGWVISRNVEFRWQYDIYRRDLVLI